jgi:hypothetical protein
MDITLEELVEEMGKTYNKELTICIQNLQIQKLEKIVGDREEEEE